MSKPSNTEVFFSPAQLQYLETLFPAVVLGPTASDASMRFFFGQQSVVKAVRERTRGLNAKTASVGDIPMPR